MYKFEVVHKDLSVSTILATNDQFQDTFDLVRSWFDNSWITEWRLVGKMSDPSDRV